jgi:hypothetical protein
MSLRGDIDRIKTAVGEERWPPAAIAIFACSGRGLYTEVPLPEHVPDRVIVDATPHARPMLALLAEHPRSCVAVVDRATGRFCELYQDELSELDKVTDLLSVAWGTCLDDRCCPGTARPRLVTCLASAPPRTEATRGQRAGHLARRIHMPGHPNNVRTKVLEATCPASGAPSRRVHLRSG